jgi:lipoate-protein ligase B
MSNTIHLVPVYGRVPYAEGLAWQRRLAREKIEGRLIEDLILLLEHDPVLTFGRSSRGRNVVADPKLLAANGIEAVEVERGGDVTYHGPGQLVGYPIIDLGRYRRDLHWYLRRLEEALVLALAELDVGAFRVPGHTGVWVGEDDRITAADMAAGRIRKIASIGVHVSRWVTWHGFALNVSQEPLRNFELIVPCGIDDVRMTSLEAEGKSAHAGAVRVALATGFARAFDAEVSIEGAIPPGVSPRLAGRAADCPAERTEEVYAVPTDDTRRP